MNYGLMLSTTGVLTSMHRMDLMSGNLANIDTPGFKPHITAVMQRRSASEEDGLGHLPSNRMLERLGGGVLSGRGHIVFRQGSLERTDSPLDLAIEGEGFFVMQTGQGSDDQRYRLTRDGRMTRAADGTLVSSTTGMPVLGVNERPIRLRSDGPVAIDSDGTLSQGGQTVGRLLVATVPDPQRLVKVGDGLFGASSAVLETMQRSGALVRQGMLESSGVDPIRAMLQVQSAGSAVGANSRMIELHDRLMDQAINRLSRIA